MNKRIIIDEDIKHPTIKSESNSKIHILNNSFRRAICLGLNPIKSLNFNLETAVVIDILTNNATVIISKLVYPQSYDPNKFLIFTIDGRIKLLTKNKVSMDSFTIIGPHDCPNEEIYILRQIPVSYYFTPEHYNQIKNNVLLDCTINN